MYKLFERVPKSEKHPYGSKLVVDNPFEGPCLLCISAFYNSANNLPDQYENYDISKKIADKSNFGLSKIGMEMAGLRTRGGNNAGFDIEDFPVRIMSMALDRTSEAEGVSEETRTNDFVKRYLEPLVSQDGKKIECTQAMKNMRNVNMISFCNGTRFIENIQEILMERLQTAGYSEEECTKIMSQMCIFPFATDKVTGKETATCVSFKDINDSEISYNVTSENKSIVSASETGGKLFKYSKNVMEYLANGEGDHTLTKYARRGKVLSASVTSVISKALQSSIENAKGQEFTPITPEGLTADISKFEQMAKEGKSQEEIMLEAYNSLQYDGAKRLTEEEMDLLDEQDRKCDEFLKNELKNKMLLTMNELTREALEGAKITTEQVAQVEDQEQIKKTSDEMLKAGFSRGEDL